MNPSLGESQSYDEKEFAVAFACSVTSNTSNVEDLIAKNGNEGIYDVLRFMLPQVIPNTCHAIITMYDVRYNALSMPVMHM